jgi:tetratricopeptide (TPR) repeat protein
MQRTWQICLSFIFLLAGCTTPGAVRLPADVDLDNRLNEAAKSNRPLAILVLDGNNRDDSARLDLVGSPDTSSPIEIIEIDISNSKNRAIAARFHPTVTPLLLCLTPDGIIVSRDEKPGSAELVRQRLGAAITKSAEIDSQLASLKSAVARTPADTDARLKLADFLLASHNDREAIPQLEAVAHRKDVPAAVRVRAWVNLVKAHQWVLEPEKGRHEAKALIATLGAQSPLARAGGMLVLGIQDANAKRFDLAQQEYEQAVAAAPDSIYAQEATIAEQKLPSSPQTQAPKS